MIENWIKAVIVLFAGLIVFVVLLPVYNTLMPTIQSLFGSTVSLMLGGAIILIATGLIYNFVYMAGETNQAR